MSISNSIEIMDTTLRDGEQMEGVQYSEEEKLIIAKLLLQEVGVDRIEVGSALVSEGEKRGIKKIIEWGKEEGLEEKIEILGFINEKSVEWIEEVGGKVMNLLAKGSINHIEKQLRQTPAQHIERVMEIIDYAKSRGIDINIYLEDVSRGIQQDSEFLDEFINNIKNKVMRVMFPDTLGVMEPDDITSFLPLIKKIKKKDFHAHNDYGLATANTLRAVKLGFTGVHVTVNGMGERAGNAPLEEVVVAIKDFTNKRININEKALPEISEIVERFSGKRISPNKPIVGSNIFTQTAGVHADGDKKGLLYVSKLNAERFGKRRSYALGKLSGKASIEFYLKKWGIEVDKDTKKKIVERVIRLGDKKERITEVDLLFIVRSLLDEEKEKIFEILDVEIVSHKSMSPVAIYKIKVKGEIIEGVSRGVGGFDAFMRGIRQTLKGKLIVPSVKDYVVTIPKGGKSDALANVEVIWKYKEEEFKTVGVDQDQVMASLKAIEKAINYINLLFE